MTVARLARLSLHLVLLETDGGGGGSDSGEGVQSDDGSA